MFNPITSQWKGEGLLIDDLISSCQSNGLELCVAHYYSHGTQAAAMKREGLLFYKVCKFICVDVDGVYIWHPDNRICKQSGEISEGSEIAIQIIKREVIAL